MKKTLLTIKKFLLDRFNLHEDKADEQFIVDSIKRNVHFQGTNLWTLIFAILIASIGLNVNSTAVIIGAMLISPLMGPIMGIGLGIGILDFELMKRAIKNLLIAAGISIITSSIYFSLSPLHEARTEILARTTPSVWDVLIAFFGGMAGIIAGTRKEKGNVLPGVAIATALMPPLCTAGFGLATGKWDYFFGAGYLFFINSLFICLATFIIVRSLKFSKTHYSTAPQYKKVLRYIWIIVTITIVPSIFFAFRIVQKAIFEQNARNFVQHEFNFVQTQVVNRNYKFSTKKPSIELLLIGKQLSSSTIDSLRRRMRFYKLDSSALVIHQGLDAKNEIDLAQIKASILQDVFPSKKETEKTEPSLNKLELPLPDIQSEVRLLYPDLKEFSLTQTIITNLDSSRYDTVTLLVAKFPRYLIRAEREKMSNWIKERIHTDSLKVIFETAISRE